MRWRAIMAAFAVAIVAQLPAPVAADTDACPPVPRAFWWGETDHADIVAHVRQAYGGSWEPYVEAWEKRLRGVEALRRDGSRVVIADFDIVLGGRGLDAYIAMIKSRIEAVRCLAREYVVVVGATGDPEAGGVLARSARCGTCHGAGGHGDVAGVPHLAGQDPAYLRAQLWTFRDGARRSEAARKRSTRSHPLMEVAGERVSDKGIYDLAAYYGSLACTPSTETAVAPPPAAARCRGCHGDDRVEAPAGFPRLAGQKAGYLSRQIRLFRDDRDVPSRDEVDAARHHGIMTSQAGALTDSEVDAVTMYYSRLPCLGR